MADDSNGPDTKKGKGGDKIKDAVRDAGRALNESSVDAMRSQASAASVRGTNKEDDNPRYQSVPSFKRGGTKRKAGVARLHKGEMATKAKRGKKGRGKRGRM